MYIPDPVERMDARIEDLADEFIEAQHGVPVGLVRCPYCREIRDYELISVGPSPDSAACCYECLPDDLKAAYDEFEGE
jgi:hypothetical protein